MKIHQRNISKIISKTVERSLWKSVSFFFAAGLYQCSFEQSSLFLTRKKLHPKNKDDKEAVTCQNVEEGYSTGKPLF